MSDAKSLSELRDEWLALADVGKYATELQIERANIREDCAAALAGPIERERRLVEAGEALVVRIRCMTDHVTCLECLNDAKRELAAWRSLVTPGAAQEGKGHGT